MPDIEFRGTVFPLIAVINTAQFDLLWPEPDGSPPMRFVFQIQTNRITVHCTLKAYDVTYDLSQDHMRALELVRSVVDCIAFSNGVGLTVVLDEVVTPAGVKQAIISQNPRLASLATAFKVTQKEELSVYRTVMEDPSLFASMHELIEAITLPGLVAINCGRSLDGLRNIILPNDTERKSGWIKLQDELNLGQGFREFVMKVSIPPRHGDRTDIPASVSQDVLERSWKIMNRFIEYRRRGNQPLPISEFPPLL